MPDDFPVIITSYEIVIADVKFLQKYQFKYVVVDEGHRLKNFDCRLIRELKQIPAANRLLLSGKMVEKGGSCRGKGLGCEGVLGCCLRPTGCCCPVRWLRKGGAAWARAW